RWRNTNAKKATPTGWPWTERAWAGRTATAGPLPSGRAPSRRVATVSRRRVPQFLGLQLGAELAALVGLGVHVHVELARLVGLELVGGQLRARGHRPHAFGGLAQR